MQCKFAARAALAAAIVLSPAAGICGQHSLQTSLQATLTVVSDSGSIAVVRLARNGAASSAPTLGVRPSCSPSCVVFVDRNPDRTGLPPDRDTGAENAVRSLLVTSETGSGPLALPAGIESDGATLVMYF